MRDERLGGQRGTIPVSTSESFTADEQFAGHTDRGQLIAWAEDVELRVRDWAAKRDAVSRFYAGGSRPHSGLGRAVHVPEARAASQQLTGELARQRLAADQDFEPPAFRATRSR